MILCHCTGTSDREIRRLAQEGCADADSVGRRSGAGEACRGCRVAVEEVLREAAARGSSRGASASPEGR